MHGFDEAFPTPMMEDVDFHDRARSLKVADKWVPTAVIDHPPRPRRSALTLGKSWESRVLFIYKFHQRDSIILWLPVHVLKVRCHEILKTGIRIETIVGAATSVLEWLYVAGHVVQWQRKYRSIYAS